MNIRSSIIGLLLSCAGSHGSDKVEINFPNDSYYQAANLERLTAEGVRKHAPLAIIIDQAGVENPYDKEAIALTQDFVNVLKKAFVPIIVSHSIVYNYCIASYSDPWFNTKDNAASFNAGRLYDIPRSSFFLWVPDYYVKNYGNAAGLNIKGLRDISNKLPNAHGYESITAYIAARRDDQPFSVDDLRTVLTTIKQTGGQEDQLPIWDIVLYGHGSYEDTIISDLSPSQMHQLLRFFNGEIPVGVVYIQSCEAGGDNLNLLEFDTTMNKDPVLRNLNYILIVGSITDKPTISVLDKKNDMRDQFYSHAARLQGNGRSLDALMNDLHDFYRYAGSLHGSSNIPQVWVPGGFGFQTYQVNDLVQIIGNVKTRVHEYEHRAIDLPDSTRVALLYAENINVPVKVQVHAIKPIDQNRYYERAERREVWEHMPTLIEYLDWHYPKLKKLHKQIAANMFHYPAITRMVAQLADTSELADDQFVYEQYIAHAMEFFYPEFISMVRGDDTIQYFKEIELQSPVGKERELTGVLHFIRDAFLDIGERVTKKIFLIEELRGNNDISALLALHRLNMYAAEPTKFLRLSSKWILEEARKGRIKYEKQLPLEEKLADAIGQQITLHKVRITTSQYQIRIEFIYDNTAWKAIFSLKDGDVKPDFWEFRRLDREVYQKSFMLFREKIMPKSIDQKSIPEILQQRRAAI